MSDIWYYADADRQVGPLTLQQLKDALAAFSDTDVLVWCDRFDDWKPAKDVPELKSQIAIPPPLPTKPLPEKGADKAREQAEPLFMARSMTHEEKVEYLLRDLGQRGINQYTIAPPIYRLLWRLGFEVRPPHFASFWSLAVPMGVYFGVFGGIFLMWFALWKRLPVSLAVAAAALAGLGFGVSMAAYFRGQARLLALPRWEDYPTS